MFRKEVVFIQVNTSKINAFYYSVVSRLSVGE
jgi:hypothetical protein